MSSINILLQGVVGSTAYGLAGPDSDVDQLGIFARPTIELVSLVAPDPTIVHTHPDLTLHEAGKYVQLALKCNPTVIELIWLPTRHIMLSTPFGEELMQIRESFLSRKHVRNAYLGYATEQVRRSRGTRTAKAARHCYRLLYQGFQLYSTGVLTVELDDPQRFHAFGEVALADPSAAEEMVHIYERKFDACNTPLPEHPDVDQALDWLRRVRKAHW